MNSVTSSLDSYVEQLSRVGGELGPMVVKGMILLIIVLFLVKYLRRFLAARLIKAGMPERRAAYSVTGLHILVLLVGALVVLNLIGFAAVLLFRVIMVVVMLGIAVYVIMKTVVGEILKESEIVLEKPAPRVVIDEFSPEYMEMKARFWVERKHALTGPWGLNERIKSRFDEEGIQMASDRLEIRGVSRE